MIGQDHAKKVLSVAVYNHYKRLTVNIEEETVENQQQSNLGRPIVVAQQPTPPPNPPRGMTAQHLIHCYTSIEELILPAGVYHPFLQSGIHWLKAATVVFYSI